MNEENQDNEIDIRVSTDARLEIETILCHTFSNTSYLFESCIHASRLNEERDINFSNERLEFLGDTLLNFWVASFLFNLFPSQDEGLLSEKKSFLVDGVACREYTLMLSLEKYLIVSKGERHKNSMKKKMYIADFFEALLGALFCDGGYDAVDNFLETRLAPYMKDKLKTAHQDEKTALQNYSQRHFHSLPEYVEALPEGPSHSVIFTSSVFINDVKYGEGKGSSKKEAQKTAAKAALEYVREYEPEKK